jgi:tetratricopeptide (TPR) repeat protein
MKIFGRRSEREALDRLIDGARAGRSGVVVLRGEPGAGKTALLDYAIDSASDLHVARAAGVESERELAFAALHQLCAPVLDRLERLPGPQRDAVAVTFGLSEGPVPDRFMVGLGVLSLLSEAAEDRPLLCVVDDAQWLDKASAQGLAFVARRLLAESVVLLFAAREAGEDLRDLPQMVVGGLSNGDARELLASVVPWSLDERVREQIVAETQGNPLALIELTRGLSRAQVAGGFGLQNALSLEGRIEERFLTRLEALSADSRTLLLLAAAEPTGDAALLWRAAERLGVTDQVSGPAEVNGLLEVGIRVRFRHPLIRSAVYRAASPQERRDTHRALGEATDQHADPDRRAWHLAEAAAGPDEKLAAELERSAERARARGGLAAAASFLERAVALTPDRSLRADRALAAAQRSVQAGAVGAVESLLVVAEAGVPSDLQQARADEVRAQLAFVTSRGRDAVPLLVDAAKRLEPIAPDIAQATYLDAVQAAIFAGRLATPGGALRDVARAASAAPPRAPTAAGLFLEGLAANFSHGYAAGVPILRRALTAFGDRIPTDEVLRGSGPACIVAAHLWDDEALEAVSERWVTLCRQAGALGDLPRALNARAHALMFAGDLTGAASLLREVAAASEATGIQIGPVGNMALAALRGDEAEALALIETSVRDAPLRGEGNRLPWVEWANAVLNNGLGRHQQALASA